MTSTKDLNVYKLTFKAGVDKEKYLTSDHDHYIILAAEVEQAREIAARVSLGQSSSDSTLFSPWRCHDATDCIAYEGDVAYDTSPPGRIYEPKTAQIEMEEYWGKNWYDKF